MDKLLKEIYNSAQKNEDLELQFTILKEHLNVINLSEKFELGKILKICETLELDMLVKNITTYLNQKNKIEQERSRRLVC